MKRIRWTTTHGLFPDGGADAGLGYVEWRTSRIIARRGAVIAGRRAVMCERTAVLRQTRGALAPSSARLV
jgi:hypothetical protein